MPAFLGLSGYLFNLPKSRSQTTRDFIGSYGKRLILPWLFAFVVYTVVVVRPKGSKAILEACLYPWHHLWYVPVFTVYISIAKFLRLSRTSLFIVAAMLSCLSLTYFGVFSIGGIRPNFPLAHSIEFLLGDKRVYTMAVFFFAGLFVGRSKLVMTQSKAITIVVLVLVLLATWTMLFGTNQLLPLLATFLFLNLLIILLYPYGFSQMKFWFSPLNRLGVNSLFYYLWHQALFLASARWIYPHFSQTTSWVQSPWCAKTLGFLRFEAQD